MTKRAVWTAAALAAASAVVLTGCDTTSGESGEVSGEEPRIALVMSHMTNEFTTTIAGAAEAKGEDLGYAVTVFDGEQDAATQVSQIEQAVSQGFDGILVEPVSTDGVVPGLLAANDAGIPIATIVQRASEQSLAASYIGGDEERAGELQMQHALEDLGGQGSIAVLYGPMGSDAQITRNEGYETVLAENPDVSVAFEQSGNWVTAEALNLVENWLSTGEEIDAIVAQNDGMAVGAVQAIDNAGRAGEIAVYGIDATADGIAAIEAGGLAGTVSQDTAGMGELGVETMAKLIDGEQVPDEVLTEAVWITAENLDELE
ncbi:sugar ABC transporter substrate-binding protein [Microbacterium halophytorum]|uniref:sugar ABC transporter substrate-binding protein n=1 Tax=Microbacterium halophytorum TaxID=2067568 RepID=UPI000CFCF88E|nr:sugar ABC transporter substrate-binding protein [Microbacterium halophytorum]